eukprot:TRINITY_DN14103_c0_g1_i1.p1 TRINITY_DN14103_c0_g1~~TRINITY_DN14103_c0_g1_i1.p1  ORF type:complete len:518 (-),score=80.49 TRINITY_DN14103_c0_g1_i1:176-1660(-)
MAVVSPLDVLAEVVTTTTDTASAKDSATAADSAVASQARASSRPLFTLGEHCGDVALTGSPRVGTLLGSLPTPRCTVMTSRGVPLQLRPEIYFEQLGNPQLVQVPLGDLLIRRDEHFNAADGCKSFWPHLEGHFTYSSFRNPRLPISIYGGDSLCSVETIGGRRKAGPKEMLETQRLMRTAIVAAPGEDVLPGVSTRRPLRAVTRSAEWLKELVDAKTSDKSLAFDWHVLASIQGGGDTKLRQKACQLSVAVPGVSGVWIGGLGYDETLSVRASILKSVTAALPAEFPRFLPLNVGTPVEVLQAILLGVDIVETSFPVQAANQGMAFCFSVDMPEGTEVDEEILQKYLSPPEEPAQEPEPEDSKNQGASSQGAKVGAASANEAAALTEPRRDVRSIQLRLLEFKEDFVPLTPDSAALPYTRAYVHHLLQLRELLGTQLLVRHNNCLYEKLLEAIRGHIEKGTLRRFASWFFHTQTSDPPEAAPAGPVPKKRKVG